MAFDKYARGSDAISLTLGGAKGSRTFHVPRWTAFLFVGVLPCLGTWYLGATLYFVFHDQLLAALMTRQADMQYSYEDKISALRTQLDREASRGLIDRHTLDTTVRDLTARSAQLEARAAAIDSIVVKGVAPAARSALPAPDGRSASLALTAPSLGDDTSTLSTGPQLRLDQSDVDAAKSEKHSELTPQERSDAIAAVLDRVERSQAKIVADLRDPMIQNVSRLRTALAETGLPPQHLQLSQGEGGIGGPFVPLPDATARGFDDNMALLRDAVELQAKLNRIVDHVPLRRPLDGPLEVTSTFGARLDPFYGRPAMHTGIDLHEPYGDSVEATAAGVVTIASQEGGYGNMVEIDHGNGLTTRYAHLSAIEVRLHEKVKVGDVVGRVGSTGRSTGPHLHYEVRIDGEPVDPARFLKASVKLFPG